MTSKPASLRDSQDPRIRVAPRAAKTFGDIAGQFSADYGLEPDPWQQGVLDDWLATDKHDRWKSLTCGLTVPRQNGKNALIEIRELFGMVGRGEKILHTAHEVKTAQKHFRRLKYFFGQKSDDPGAKYPELNALVSQVRSVNGQEAIFLKNGGSVELVARSKNSGRGFTVDVLVMDEAQEMSEDALEALMPTTSAAPLGNPQWIFTGTPPSPSADGEVFTRVRREALAEHPGRMCWHEWSPDELYDLDDRELWRMTNPGLATGRLQMEVVEGERARFSDEGFARERLGKWANDFGSHRLISASQWDATTADPPTDGVRSFAVTFSQDGSRQAVAGGVKHDGRMVHVNLVGSYTGSTEAGVSALADWLAERKARTAWIVLCGKAGATVLAEALEARGVPKRMVHVMSTPEYFTANAMLLDAVREKTVTHPEGAPGDALNESVAVCDKKERGRDGAWGWEPTTPDGDETPMEAVSAVVWAARTTKRRPNGSRSGGGVTIL